MFGGVPTGVAKAQDAATAIAISTACGSAPICCAMEMPIGQSSAAEAVFDMNCVRPQDKAKRMAVTTSGLGLPPGMI